MVARVEESDRLARRAQLAALERRRRTLIAALVKIDAEIAELRASPLARPLAMTSNADADVGFDVEGYVELDAEIGAGD